MARGAQDQASGLSDQSPSLGMGLGRENFPHPDHWVIISVLQGHCGFSDCSVEPLTFPSVLRTTHFPQIVFPSMPPTHSKAESKKEEAGTAGEILPTVCGSGSLANRHGLIFAIPFTDMITGGRTVHEARQKLEGRELESPKSPQCSVKCGRKNTGCVSRGLAPNSRISYGHKRNHIRSLNLSVLTLEVGMPNPNPWDFCEALW